MKVLVLTVSDRASKGEYEDRSGPAVVEVMREQYPEAEVTSDIVPDESDRIEDAFRSNTDKDFILTTGGTGLSSRDVTPEATERFCDRLIPGIAEFLRAQSMQQTPNAMLSRGVAGVKGRTIIINLPGSVRGAEFCAQQVAPMLEHACAMVRGGGH